MYNCLANQSLFGLISVLPVLCCCRNQSSASPAAQAVSGLVDVDHFSEDLLLYLSCRCYELQCLTGVVNGNFTGPNNTPVPYNTSTGFIQPGLNYDTVLDDYNRTWNGNPLMAQDELFTQCWNGTQVPTHLYSSAVDLHCVLLINVTACEAVLALYAWFQWTVLLQASCLPGAHSCKLCLLVATVVAC